MYTGDTLKVYRAATVYSLLISAMRRGERLLPRVITDTPTWLSSRNNTSLRASPLP